MGGQCVIVHETHVPSSTNTSICIWLPFSVTECKWSGMLLSPWIYFIQYGKNVSLWVMQFLYLMDHSCVWCMQRLKHVVKMNIEHKWMRRHLVAAFVFRQCRLNILPGHSSLLLVFQYLFEPPSCSGLACRFVAF